MKRRASCSCLDKTSSQTALAHEEIGKLFFPEARQAVQTAEEGTPPPCTEWHLGNLWHLMFSQKRDVKDRRQRRQLNFLLCDKKNKKEREAKSPHSSCSLIFNNPQCVP